MFKNIELYGSVTSERHLLYVEEGIAAGFPSPAQDYVCPTLDLNELLVPHPAATLIGRVTGFFEYEDIKKDTDRLGIKLVATKGAENISLTRAPKKAVDFVLSQMK